MTYQNLTKNNTDYTNTSKETTSYTNLSKARTAEYLVTEALKFLMTEDDNYIMSYLYEFELLNKNTTDYSKASKASTDYTNQAKV